MGREIGASIGDYRLIRMIGSGASGEVFEAGHVITRRVEAIKFLAHGAAANSEAERRLLREIEIQASLQHPNIAAVHNAFWTPEGLALVMELVDGEPLSNRLERGRIPLLEGARYVLQTLEALAYAHDHGVVHRDVKPSNIVVARDGSIKLTDFGLARTMDDGQAGSGTLAGSPYYMSPEQVVGLWPADARSDCYSVGVILYEIATGRRPFEGESAFDVMLQHRETVPEAPMARAPRVGAGLNGVILKAMEKDPARRFQSAGEFRMALEGALAGSRRKGRWVAAAAMAGLAATAAILAPVVRRPAPVRSLPASIEAAPEPPAPVVEPRPEPVETDPPAPAPTPPRTGRERRPAAKRTPAAVAPQPAAAAPAPIVVQPKIEPKAEEPIAKPAEPEAVPESEPASQPAKEADQHDAQPQQPVKRRSLLRRAFGRIVHPWGKSEPERLQLPKLP